MNKNYLNTLLNWFFGILFGLVGLSAVFSEFIPGITMLLMAIILLPPTNKMINERWDFNITGYPKLLSIFIGLIIVGLTIKDTSVEQINNQPFTSPQQKSEERYSDHYQKNDEYKNMQESSPFTISEIKKPPQNIHTETDFNLIIKNRLNKIGKYDISVWTLNGNYVKIGSKPPFEIFINTSNGQIESCYEAKEKLFQIMKTIFTDNQIKDKIARVKFTAWGLLKASLGAKDTEFNWNESSYPNFWSVLHQYNSHEDESSLVNQRTYGVSMQCK